MTEFAVERALWDAVSGPDKTEQFISDPDGFLEQYVLSDHEKSLLKEKNVRALAEQGQSQMLLMMFYIFTSGGFGALPEYLGQMNAPAR